MIKKSIITTFLFSITVFSLCAQSTSPEWTEGKAKKWCKKKEYLNGLNGTPHESIDKVQFAQQYHLNKAVWDKAFAFLKNTDLMTLTPGRHEIDGTNAFALVSEAPTKDYDKTAFESHKNYIDLQFVIRGEEKMGKAPIATVVLDKEYNEQNDIMFYTGDGKIYSVPQDTFILFFPSDAHRPGITPGGNKVVKKVVIKIHVATL